MPDPRSQSYQHNMLYEGLDQTVTHGPPEGELPRSWFDPSTWFSRPEEVLAVVLDQHPGTQYWTDFAGNIIVDVPGIGVRYLNTPGLSFADAQSVVGNYVMADNGAQSIGRAAVGAPAGYLAARLGAQAGGAAGAAAFGSIGGIVGGAIGYVLRTAVDRLWIDPARDAILEGLEMPTLPEPQRDGRLRSGAPYRGVGRNGEQYANAQEKHGSPPGPKRDRREPYDPADHRKIQNPTHQPRQSEQHEDRHAP